MLGRSWSGGKKKTTQNRGKREPEEEGWIFYWGQGWAANVVMSK